MLLNKASSRFITFGHAFGSRMRLFKKVKMVEKTLFISRSVSKESHVNSNKCRNENFERLYFSNVMLNNPNYPSCTFSDSMITNEDTANRLVLRLRHLAASENAKDSSLVSDSIKNDSFTVDDLIEIFYILSIPEVWERMRDEQKDIKNYVKNYKNFSRETDVLSKYLILLHLSVKVNNKISRALYFIFFRLVNRYEKMTKTEIIEFFYYVHFHNKLPLSKKLGYEFEEFLVNFIPNYTLDEMAVITYAFFRSESHPGNLLTKTITEKIMAESSNWNDLQATVFSKVRDFFHFNGRRNITQCIQKIMEENISTIDRYSLSTAIHVGCSGISVNVENPELINRILEKTVREFSSARLKDLERLLLSCLFSNVRLSEESEIIKLIKENLESRKDEITRHPRSLLSLLQYLIMYGIYLIDHIDFALSEDFVELLRSRKLRVKLHELLFIDVSLEIERPEYKGNRLSTMQRKRIALRSIHEVPYAEYSSSWRRNSELIVALENMYGIKMGKPRRLLMNYETEHPLLRLNQDNQAEEIPDNFQTSSFTFVKPLNDGNRWVCFIVVRRQGCLSDGITPNLVTEAKLRQFKAAGYIPVMIPNITLVKKTEEERESYIREVVQNALH